MNCPICEGEMWDNRETKKNPRAPDYKCRDTSCEGVIWPPKDKKPASKPSPGPAPKSDPKWTWQALAKTYERCLLTAEMRVLASAERLGVKATVADVLQGTATIFIEVARNGVSEPIAKLPPKSKEAEPDPEWELEEVE